jgi:hypothetical protein
MLVDDINSYTDWFFVSKFNRSCNFYPFQNKYNAFMVRQTRSMISNLRKL